MSWYDGTLFARLGHMTSSSGAGLAETCAEQNSDSFEPDLAILSTFYAIARSCASPSPSLSIYEKSLKSVRAADAVGMSARAPVDASGAGALDRTRSSKTSRASAVPDREGQVLHWLGAGLMKASPPVMSLH